MPESSFSLAEILFLFVMYFLYLTFNFIHSYVYLLVHLNDINIVDMLQIQLPYMIATIYT